MPRFAANLTMLFTEMPMLERFAAAAEAVEAGGSIVIGLTDPVRATVTAYSDSAAMKSASGESYRGSPNVGTIRSTSSVIPERGIGV